MEKIKQFIDKYYHILIIVFTMFILYNTFNTDDSIIDNQNKILNNQLFLNKKIQKQDSVNLIKYNLDLQLNILKGNKEFAYILILDNTSSNDKDARELLIKYDNKLDSLNQIKNNLK